MDTKWNWKEKSIELTNKENRSFSDWKYSSTNLWKFFETVLRHEDIFYILDSDWIGI